MARGRNDIRRLVPPVRALQRALERNEEDADILRALLRASLDYEIRCEEREQERVANGEEFTPDDASGPPPLSRPPRRPGSPDTASLPFGSRAASRGESTVVASRRGTRRFLRRPWAR